MSRCYLWCKPGVHTSLTARLNERDFIDMISYFTSVPRYSTHTGNENNSLAVVETISKMISNGDECQLKVICYFTELSVLEGV